MTNQNVQLSKFYPLNSEYERLKMWTCNAMAM